MATLEITSKENEYRTLATDNNRKSNPNQTVTVSNKKKNDSLVMSHSQSMLREEEIKIKMDDIEENNNPNKIEEIQEKDLIIDFPDDDIEKQPSNISLKNNDKLSADKSNDRFINKNEVSDFHERKKSDYIGFNRYNKESINDGRQYIENKYVSKIINQLQQVKSVKIFNIKQTKMEVELHFKRKMEECILYFNARQFEQAYQCLKGKVVDDYSDFAEVLLVYKGFDKNILGDFLSKTKPPNDKGEILKYFMQHLDLKTDIISAMRLMLSLVNMPQDASLMLIIIDIFTQVYFEDNSDKFSDVLKVYLLACSILSLNSLFHNTNHKDKMEVGIFLKMNAGVDENLCRSIYEEIKTKKIEIVYDYTSLFYKVVNNPNEKDDFDYIKLLQDGETFLKYGKSGDPHKRFVYLSYNEKKICWRKVDGCSSCYEKRVSVNDLEFAFMGRRGMNFQKFKIDASLEQNCISLTFKYRTLDLRNDDDKKSKKWFKAFKYLLMKVQSKEKLHKENKNLLKKKRLESGIFSKELIKGIWKTEILPNWSKYRNMVIRNNSNFAFVDQDNQGNKKEKFQLMFYDIAEKLGLNDSTKPYFESGKYDFAYIWSLGIPDLFRKKIWLITIGNANKVDGFLYNSLEIDEYVNFEKLMTEIGQFERSKFNFSTMNLQNFVNSKQVSYAEMNKNNLISDKSNKKNFSSYQMNNFSIHENKRMQQNNTLDQIVFSQISNSFSSLILIDAITLLEKHKSYIESENISCLKFVKDMFTGLKKLNILRPDIPYSNSVANIYFVLYINSDSNISAFTNMINLIYSKNSEFLIKFWDKDESFIKQRTDFFEYWLKATCPDVYNHFEKMEIFTRLYFFYWIDNLFTESFEINVLNRVWDMFLLKGEVVIYEIALAIIKYQEKELLHCLLNETIERLNKPATEICHQMLDMILNEEISLEESFDTFLREDNLALEKGLLLQTFFLEDA